MPSDLTLPGSIPGLVRGCTPVALTVVGDDGAATEADGVVVMLGREDSCPRTALVAVGVGERHPRRLVWRLLADLALDLTDATGRAHAAWWVAGRTDGGWARYDGVAGVIWRVTAAEHPVRQYAAMVRRSAPWVIVPSLSDLDPTDPRLLPDGSRWVDAEALRRVVCHVTGVTP